MMKLATIGPYGFEQFPAEQLFGLLRRTGASLLEVYRNPQCPTDADQVVRIANDAGFRIDSIHAEHGALLDLSSPDESLRRAAIEKYRHEAAFCAQVGGSLMVVHPSIPAGEDGDILTRWSQLRRSMDELEAIGSAHAVIVCIENMPPTHAIGSDVAELVQVIRTAGLEHVAFCLDTGHAHMAGSVVDAVRIAGSDIRYIHATDNDGHVDQHLLPFMGSTPWDLLNQALEDVDYRGTFMLEAFDTLEGFDEKLTSQWATRMQRFVQYQRPV